MGYVAGTAAEIPGKVQEGQPEEVWQAVQGYQCTDQNTDIPVQILSLIHIVGTYSSAEKAMKVVNMIQEAYASYKGIRTILTGITTNSEIVIAVANDKGKMDAITEALKEAAIFKMPQDSEVV